MLRVSPPQSLAAHILLLPIPFPFREHAHCRVPRASQPAASPHLVLHISSHRTSAIPSYQQLLVSEEAARYDSSKKRLCRLTRSLNWGKCAMAYLISFFGSTFPKDPSCSLLSSWAMAYPSTFLIHGESYLHDHLKVRKDLVHREPSASSKKEDERGEKEDERIISK
ncbi:protein ENHANCED DISEASE RESISTANCE 2 isoform X2 [Canna indica]|uniref:Protein ENHANCED DISEASE RESISTANCE 2 isoform X2 n=1 Tax=Canna indica TaxID=4628 RepID=A0AAQ3QDX4_9LILI|nr:protein ENHANCED DISEASE RESISTANCE 2 isoform X2 [Canna indica]